MAAAIPRIVITTGEPAGVGPELILELARQSWPAELVIFGDARLLAEPGTALLAGRSALPSSPADAAARVPSRPGASSLRTCPCARRGAPAGSIRATGPGYSRLLRQACAGCQQGYFDALVTAPVHKGAINDAGIPFTGHTEFLARAHGQPKPVMLLVAGHASRRPASPPTCRSRPCRRPSRASGSRRPPGSSHDGLRRRFGIAAPRIVVLGLNPHAGESGHLGTEEVDEINPAIAPLRAATACR